jgi:hypothetical protein
MHICHEEILAILSFFAFLQPLIFKIKNWYHKKFNCKCTKG